MSTVAKVLVVLNLVLAVAFLGFASSYLGQQDTWKTKYGSEQTAHTNTRTDLEGKISEHQTQITNQGRTITTLRGERDTSQTENALLRSEVENHKTAFDALAANLTKATESVRQLTNAQQATRDLNEALQTDNTRLREALSTASASEMIPLSFPRGRGPG